MALHTDVECIDDKNWSPEALKYIKEFPVAGQPYTVIGRTHTITNKKHLYDKPYWKNIW